jgi:signal transduction histidine kinase/CHASE3 domain sensor protein
MNAEAPSPVPAGIARPVAACGYQGCLLELIVGAVMVVTGAVVLAGWLLGVIPLTTLVPGSISTKFNTALAFILCGGALLLLQVRAGWGGSLSRLCALTAWGIGLISLLEHLMGLRIGIEEFFVRDTTGGVSPGAGLMGVSTAIGFLYGAGAVLLMGFAPVKSGSRWPDWFRWIIGSLGVLLIFSSGMAFIGNISSDFAPKPFGIYWTTSVPSVALFTLLAGAILYRVWSEGGDAWVLTLWITVALVLMMALLLGIAMLSVRSTRGLITSTRYVENSGTLISSLSKLLADLNQEQIDFQIAILTGENRLPPNHEREISRELDAIESLCLQSEHPSAHVQRIKEIREHVLQWTGFRERVLSTYEYSGIDAATRVIRTREGIGLMERIRFLLRASVAEEERMMTDHLEDEMTSSRTALSLVPASLLVLWLLLGSGSLLLNQEGASRKRADKGLRRKDALLGLALEAGKIGYWEMDLHSRMVRPSERLAQILGCAEPPAECTLESFLRHVHPSDCDRVSGGLEKSAATGEDSYLECRIIRSDGTIGWLAIWGRVQRNASGKIITLAGVGFDRTEEIQANQKLVISETRLRLATEAASIGIWDWNLTNNEVTWDAMMFSIYGIPRRGEGMVGYEDWRNRVHPDDVAEQEASLPRTIESASRKQREFRIIRASDGTTRIIRASDVAIAGEGGRIERVVGINLDITETLGRVEEIRFLNARLSERASQLESSVKELDAFSYSVSHDLRAPLRAIDGFSRIVEEDYAPKLDEEGRRMIGVIRGEARRMSRLIDDLLSFSRLSRQKIEPERIDMGAMAREVFDELAALEPDRKVHLDLHPIPPAFGTMSMIRQVWVNLIGNAVKFTKGREVAQIEIGVEGGDPGEQVYFIRDNGAGFDMRYADKLFGVFQRLHSAEEFPGTGVGLALVQRIVNRHDGRVWGEGEVGRGATFRFTIPNPGEPSAEMKQPKTTRTA